ncbi:MAG: ATP-dependent helicase C-terminal domain-containing protein [Saccharospirillum sp.]
MATRWPERPVDALKPDVLRHWRDGGCLVQSPPGSGKTTRLPLWLLEAGSKGIVLVLPRRLPVQLAAHYMAQQWQEPVGQTIGYRLRQDTQASPSTRLTITTYGTFLRWLQNDPALADIDTVMLDEFHERQLEQDLSLTLLHSCRTLFRPDLKLLVMSATLSLDTLRQALKLPEVVSQGAQYPLTLHYRPASPNQDWTAHLATVVESALQTHSGHILVFLPGLREIEQAARLLQASAPLFKLHSQMPLPDLHQQLDTSPDAVILSTNLAESSVTLPGVRVVIDSGLERYPVTDPITGLVALRTRRISKASAVQRAGRAARQAPGYGYRLWSEDQHNALPPDQPPAITEADLLPAVLALANWGITPPDAFWLTPPNAGRWQAARQQLLDWQALTAQDQLTEHGQRILALGQAPALAHLVALANEHSQGSDAVWLATALSHQPEWVQPLLMQSDLAMNRAPTLLRKEANHLARQLGIPLQPIANPLSPRTLIRAMPHRLVYRQPTGSLILASGTQVDDSTLAHTVRWSLLLSGQDKGKTVRADALLPLNETDVGAVLTHRSQIRFDMNDTHQGRFIQEDWLGPFRVVVRAVKVDTQQRHQAWQTWLASTPLSQWPGFASAHDWLARLALAHHYLPDWPGQPEPGVLAATAASYFSGLTQLRELPLLEILNAWLGYPASQDLNRLCPGHWVAPSGRHCLLHYDTEHGRVSARLKLQEAFGLAQTPTFLNGQVPLTLQLLAPNDRILAQVTDLTHFWTTVYPQVRKEVRGRYNKHPWPEDPMAATATGATTRQLAHQRREPI